MKLYIALLAVCVCVGCSHLPDIPDIPDLPDVINPPTPVETNVAPPVVVPDEPAVPQPIETVQVRQVFHEQSKIKLILAGPLPFTHDVKSVEILNATNGAVIDANGVINFELTPAPELWSSIGYWDFPAQIYARWRQGYVKGDWRRAQTPVVTHDPIPPAQ